MSESLDFELALERRLRTRAARASRPFDAAAIAKAAVATRPVRRPLAIAWPRRWGLVLAVAGLAMALVAGVAVAAALLGREPRVAVARPDGIYLLRADGSVVRRIADVGTHPRLSWSADGQLLLVRDVFDGGATRRLTVYRPDGTAAWSAPTSSVDAGSWSHRGHRIAWIGWMPSLTSTTGQMALRVTDVDDGETRELTSNVFGWSEAAEWSPDDSAVLTISLAPQGVPLVVPLDGEHTTSLAVQASGFVSHAPRWSPDGRRVAVEAAVEPGSDSRVVVLDEASGRVVDESTGSSFQLVDWSPNGSSIAFVTPGAAGAPSCAVIAHLPLSSGKVTSVFPSDGQWDLAALDGGWMPDGRFWALRTRGADRDGSDLWAANPDGTGAELLLRDVSAAAFRP